MLKAGSAACTRSIAPQHLAQHFLPRALLSVPGERGARKQLFHLFQTLLLAGTKLGSWLILSRAHLSRYCLEVGKSVPFQGSTSHEQDCKAFCSILCQIPCYSNSLNALKRHHGPAQDVPGARGAVRCWQGRADSRARRACTWEGYHLTTARATRWGTELQFPDWYKVLYAPQCMRLVRICSNLRCVLLLQAWNS